MQVLQADSTSGSGLELSEPGGFWIFFGVWILSLALMGGSSMGRGSGIAPLSRAPSLEGLGFVIQRVVGFHGSGLHAELLTPTLHSHQT